MSELPEELFEHILQEGRRIDFSLSTKALAQVALALRKGINDTPEVERCPHCSGVLRVRKLVGKQLAAVISEWLAGRAVNSEAAP
jgi:hypothetical protein